MQTMMAVNRIFIRYNASEYLDICIVECGVEETLDLGVSTSAYRN